MSQENDNVPLDEEGGSEFINLDDPNFEILDEEGGVVPQDDEESDDEGSVNKSQGEDDAESAKAEEEKRKNEAEEDLNAIPDRIPLRDDSYRTFQDPQSKPLHAIAVHPTDPCLFAVSGESEAIYILCLDPPETSGRKGGEEKEGESVAVLHTLTGHSDTISLLRFSPNGEWLASGSLDSSVAIWSTSTWEQVHSFTDLYGEIMTLLWHPSSLLLVAGCDDAQAAMWNVVKGTVVMLFAGHRDAVGVVAWSPDVKKLLTGSSDGSISLFNPKTGAQEMAITKDLSPDNAGVTALCVVSSDQCVVGCEDGTLHVVALRSFKVVMHLEELHEQAIESAEFNAGLNLLLTCSCDCKVIVWNAADFTPRNIFEAQESVIPSVWVEHRVLAGCSDGKIRVWDGRSSAAEPLRVLDGHRRMIFGIAVPENKQIAASVSDDGCAKFFSLEDEQEI